MTVQRISPASAGHETWITVLFCAFVIAVAGAYISWRHVPEQHALAAADTIDARHDLTPAEQGIYADLRVALPEILAFAAEEEGAGLPSIGQLRDELVLSPFTDDAAAARRGAHRWHAVRDGERAGYVGLSEDVSVAGALLMLLPLEQGGHDHAQAAHAPDAGEQAEVWVNRAEKAVLPGTLGREALASAGWRRVAMQFQASVTRERRQP
jgi:hypothetical protein